MSIKNIDLCMRCIYCSIITNQSGEILGRSCEVPLSKFLENNKSGLYQNDTDNTCYDFINKNDFAGA